MKFELKDFFIPFLLFLSGITAKFPIIIIHNAVTYFFAGYCIVTFIYSLIYKKNIYNKFLVSWIVIWLIWILISGVNSNYPTLVYMPIIRSFIFFITLLVIYRYIVSIKRMDYILLSFKYIGIVIALSIIIEFGLANFQLFNSHGSLMRYSGIYSGVNAAGYVISISIIVTFYHWINKKQNNDIYSFIIMFLGMMLTGSRAALVLVLFTFLFFFFGKMINKKIFVSAIVFIISGFLFCLMKFNSILSLLRLDSGNNGRTEIWESAINVIKEYPIFGCGYGALQMESIKYLKGDINNLAFQATLGNAHNLFLGISAEVGLIGLFILLILLFYVLIKLVNGNQINKLNSKYNIYRILLSFFIAFLIRSLFEQNGILSRGAMGIDIYMWIFIVIAIRMKDILKNENINNRKSIKL